MKQITYAVNPEEAFPQVEKLIYDLCWKTVAACPVTFEDARSVAYNAFMRACQDYKPDRKMKFSSWVYYWVWCDLKTWITKLARNPVTFVEIEEELCGFAPPARSDYRDLIADLSDDAKEIVSLLVDTPKEFNGQAMTPGQLMKKVKEHLVAQGRNRKVIEQACQDLQHRFQEAWA